MARLPTVKVLLGDLVGTPARKGGLLDVPLHEYLADVSEDAVVRLFEIHAEAHRRPTLRAVLSDPRFRRWVETSSKSALRTKVERELAIVAGILDVEEDTLEPKDEQPEAAGGPATASIARWAEDRGVAARLRDSAKLLAPRVPAGLLRSVLNGSARATIAEVLDGTLSRTFTYVTPRDAEVLVAVAKAHVVEAGERAVRERREAARVAKLAYVPEGEGVRAFLDALRAELANGSTPAAQITSTRVSFERDPVRFEAYASHDGKKGSFTMSLPLDAWASAPLGARIRSDRTAGRTRAAGRWLLGTLSRVLGDPESPAHAPLVAYLNEPAWQRVLARVDALAADPAASAEVTPMTWIVTSRNGSTHITPFVHERGSLRPSDVDAIVRGFVRRVRALDEAVARTLFVAPARHAYAYGGRPAYDYESMSAPRARERAFRALEQLADPRADVRMSPNGPRVRIVQGAIGVAVAEDGPGFRLAFDVEGEPVGVAAVRAGLDDAGRLLVVDPASDRVLLGHVGMRKGAVLAALASESATFPAEAADALVARVLALREMLPIVLPTPLAGEPATADARPVVRVTRRPVADVETLAVAWFVRPLPGGATYVPGEGAAQLLEQIGGRVALAVRALDEERKLVTEARSRLPPPTVRTVSGEDEHHGIDAMLAAIEALRAGAEDGAIVVEWPKSLPRVVGDASWSSLHLRVTNERDWFGLHGSIEVDGVEITLADLLAARRRGDRFVAVGPDKLVALGDELRARLGDLEAVVREARTGLTLVNAAAPVLAELVPSRKQLEATREFSDLLARIDRAAASEPRIPRGFSTALRPYQVEGFRWMCRLAAWGAGACLADEMGLGKTVQTLALLVARSKDGPALVVAPTSVGPNWVAEARRFAPSLNVIVHRGAGRGDALASLGPGDLLVTSYELMARDAEALSDVTFTTLVLDEAQAIKNGATARARAARSLRADFRLALSGTPVENRLAELFSLMEFLNPGLLGTEESFRARFVLPIERDRDPARSAALARVVRPFLLRRKKADVLAELPARIEVTRTVEPTPAEKKIYESARLLALAALTGKDEQARFRILAEITRLRRLACHPKLEDPSSEVPSSKLEAFLAMVSELREAGHRALVFSQFTGHLGLVQEALRARHIPHLYLDGKTPVAERTKRVSAFQGGFGDLFLISLKAGGTGLNLTAADTVIHLDPWWNPAVEDQATDRAHRIGQQRPVTVVRLLAQGTIEEAVVALHAEKRQLAESILDGSGASGKLSIAELGALIREGM
jgi:hypothetical protein